ncbi:hypothetical protein PHLGIDRAFT_471546 [Phlebiopsis gigantea 11061_1 CR5-6]|uniref:C2H2-type domain-containing protein n=1 Tax=Phlebiopsis gigantea (strain 11061_1 CR5-6) TaxID=745531 RepID=A0A0C3S9C8_PHLG1|nr:hypothetical protein PHLGIDRAFT_471546 [Phlebiopsis gigantea 11061_1 CR5-6]
MSTLPSFKDAFPDELFNVLQSTSQIHNRTCNDILLRMVSPSMLPDPSISSPFNSDSVAPHPSGRICMYCRRTFTKPSTLRTHLVTHTRQKPYRCIDVGCSRKYSTRSNMLRHLRTHTSGRDRSTSASKVESTERVEAPRSSSRIAPLPGAPSLSDADSPVFMTALSESLFASRRLPPPWQSSHSDTKKGT